jgi:hypothetical protein
VRTFESIGMGERKRKKYYSMEERRGGERGMETQPSQPPGAELRKYSNRTEDFHFTNLNQRDLVKGAGATNQCGLIAISIRWPTGALEEVIVESDGIGAVSGGTTDGDVFRVGEDVLRSRALVLDLHSDIFVIDLFQFIDERLAFIALLIVTIREELRNIGGRERMFGGSIE